MTNEKGLMELIRDLVLRAFQVCKRNAKTWPFKILLITSTLTSLVMMYKLLSLCMKCVTIEMKAIKQFFSCGAVQGCPNF